MSNFLLNNGHELNDFSVPYFIAEVNSSHGGDLDKAKAMVQAAKSAGADCVKFQSWSPETLYSTSYYKNNPIAKRFVKKFSFSPEQLKEMSDFCSSIDIDFSSTPYSKDEADFLVNECKVPFVKIASMEINHHDYLEHIGKTGSAIILSTGMAEMEEIVAAVNVIKATGNTNICVLHCVSVYPAPDEMINLNNIYTLRTEIPDTVIGYSDHTIGSAVPVASVAMGVPVIEKHLTLDKSDIGMDNKMATEPDDFADMIALCKSANVALGAFERTLDEEETQQRLNMRRSIVSTRDLKVGETINPDDICFKRPGDGFPPTHAEQLIGKTLSRDVPADHVIYPDDIS